MPLPRYFVGYLSEKGRRPTLLEDPHLGALTVRFLNVDA